MFIFRPWLREPLLNYDVPNRKKYQILFIIAKVITQQTHIRKHWAELRTSSILSRLKALTIPSRALYSNLQQALNYQFTNPPPPNIKYNIFKLLLSTPTLIFIAITIIWGVSVSRGQIASIRPCLWGPSNLELTEWFRQDCSELLGARLVSVIVEDGRFWVARNFLQLGRCERPGGGRDDAVPIAPD